MNWRAMAYSSETRGFLPPVNDAERLCMKRVADQIHAVKQTETARTTTFLNEREQILAIAQLNRNGHKEYIFEGGYPEAERKMLCIFSDALPENAFSIVSIFIAVRGGAVLTHRDYLGALMALQIKREQIGDILTSETGATVFLTSKMATFVCDTLCEIGRFSATVTRIELPLAPQTAQEPAWLTATVSSLRLDALLAAMLKTSRSVAAEYIRTKAVMINHVETTDIHGAVYAGDIFSVRGKGKYKLCEISGKSKKDRTFVSYIQY
ncbi:MAG: YlmH/Sll1252 family protein [Ruthenibacterium sp.]